jgi:hypothetical protein
MILIANGLEEAARELQEKNAEIRELKSQNAKLVDRIINGRPHTNN